MKQSAISPICTLKAIFGSNTFIFTHLLDDITCVESIIVHDRVCYRRCIFDGFFPVIPGPVIHLVNAFHGTALLPPDRTPYSMLQSKQRVVMHTKLCLPIQEYLTFPGASRTAALSFICVTQSVQGSKVFSAETCHNGSGTTIDGWTGWFRLTVVILLTCLAIRLSWWLFSTWRHLYDSRGMCQSRLASLPRIVKQCSMMPHHTQSVSLVQGRGMFESMLSIWRAHSTQADCIDTILTPGAGGENSLQDIEFEETKCSIRVTKGIRTGDSLAQWIHKAAEYDTTILTGRIVLVSVTQHTSSAAITAYTVAGKGTLCRAGQPRPKYPKTTS